MIVRADQRNTDPLSQFPKAKKPGEPKEGKSY